ncbi:MAG: Ribosomal RNA-processing protein 7 [Pleopsidium flavum]|nr:MAG: Ribosomal RNA-processing protein 7 [Pleopsidium flavum]
MAKVPLRISDYLILPLALRPQPSFPTPATHYLYLRPHEPKIPTPDTPRSLFLVNVPFDATEIHIRHLFATQLGGGRVERVEFEDSRSHSKPAVAPSVQTKKGRKRKRTEVESMDQVEGAELPAVWDRELHHSGSTAVAVFVDRASMEASLKALKKTAKERRKIDWGEGIEDKVPSLGSARYFNHHKLRYPDKSSLLESINTYMTAFASLEATRAQALARQRSEPDEDGFITVTKGGRNGPVRQEEAQERAEKQKEKQKGLDDFYRFQTREKRKERAGELMRKFEEDKEKVRRMRERRGRFRVGVPDRRSVSILIEDQPE